MKLVSRKTRKQIKKAVRKAMKKHGDAVVATLVSGIATSLATLARTESADQPGKSNLAALTDRARRKVKSAARSRGPEKKASFEPQSA